MTPLPDDRDQRHSIIMRHERTRTVIEDPRTGAQELILQLRREIAGLRSLVAACDKTIAALRAQPCARCAKRDGGGND